MLIGHDIVAMGESRGAAMGALGSCGCSAIPEAGAAGRAVLSSLKSVLETGKPVPAQREDGSAEVDAGSGQEAIATKPGLPPQTADFAATASGVDLLERGRARAQLLLVERVERRSDRVEIVVQVLGLALDVEQAGDDLAWRPAAPG